MRTTVDLPPAAHRRVKELALQRGQSISTTLAELTLRGLGQLTNDTVLSVSDRTGLPVISLGRRVTSDEVAELLDDE